MSFFKKTVADREKVKLMLGLTGVSGSGKTFSALQLAYGITGNWSKIALADTENKSALYYAGEDKTGPWQHIEFPSSTVIQGKLGYHPDNWVALIEEVEKDPSIEVLILDSISHEWQGKGGCLELSNEGKSSFSAWKHINPRHTSFIDKMRESRLHIIATMRSVAEYATELNEKGKVAPKKIGTKSNQREGVDYEFGIIFDIEISHHASVSKDRTGIYTSRGSFFITPETGKELLDWANSGRDPLDEIYSKTNSQAKILMSYFATHNITEKEEMTRISDLLMGKPLKHIEELLNG